MNNRPTVVQGLNVGLGVFLYNALISPLISDKGFASGVREGTIAGLIAVALFAIVAAVRSAKVDEAKEEYISIPKGLHYRSLKLKAFAAAF